MREIADHLIRNASLDSSCYLIPAPQHSGAAEYTREIAEMVATATGAKVLDILRCRPHEPLYEQKLSGSGDAELQLHLVGDVPEYGRLFFVDNVIATGTTYNHANGLFVGRLIPLVLAIDYGRFRAAGWDIPVSRSDS